MPELGSALADISPSTRLIRAKSVSAWRTSLGLPADSVATPLDRVPALLARRSSRRARYFGTPPHTLYRRAAPRRAGHFRPESASSRSAPNKSASRDNPQAQSLPVTGH